MRSISWIFVWMSALGALGYLLYPDALESPKHYELSNVSRYRIEGVRTAGRQEAALPTLPAIGWEAAVERVGLRCDLQPDLSCAPGGCVAMISAPDLDRFEGWVSMGMRSPRFLLGAAMRELGLPSECSGLVTHVSGENGILSVEREDGSELWCVGQGKAMRARCEQQALNYGVSGFLDPNVRVLEFGI